MCYNKTNCGTRRLFPPAPAAGGRGGLRTIILCGNSAGGAAQTARPGAALQGGFYTMWTCGLLKENAKRALQGRYWVCFAACFLAALLGGSNALAATVNVNINISQQLEYAMGLGQGAGGYAGQSLDLLIYLLYLLQQSGLLTFFLVAMLAASLVALAFSIFVSNPIRAGLCRYMMESRQGNAPLGTLFSTFRTPYGNLVKVILLTDLKILLGYLLFVVPGVIWSYRYRMVPYLMAENPYLSTGRAMELSRQMMHGEKWHTFVLELSFLGWSLLCVLTLGIGYVFLQPYVEATFAELYAALRSKAFAYGYADESELGGFVTHEFPGR